MRTGPSSSTVVIKRLNASFVPVFALSEDYRDGGSAPKEEQTKCNRIYREVLDKKYSAGTVHVYVLNPTGEVIGTRHVAESAKTMHLISFLDDVLKYLATKKGQPLVDLKAQSAPPKHEKDSLV